MFKQKVSTKPKNFSIADIYGYYVKKVLTEHPNWTAKREGHIANGRVFDEAGLVVMTYKKFKEILGALNTEFGNRLIRGYTVDLLNRLGDIYIARIERNPNNLKVNYNESKRLKAAMIAKGEEVTKDNWIVYYTDEEYIKLKHHKGLGLANLRFYHFKLASGPKGYRKRMSQEIQANRSLKALYPLIPYKY